MNLKQNAVKVASDVVNVFRAKGIHYDELTFVALYILFKASENDKVDLKSFDCFAETSGISQDRIFFLRDVLIAESQAWEIIVSLHGRFDSEVLKQAIVDFEQTNIGNSPNSATPSSLSELAIKLLKIKAGSHVIDLGSGTGTFLKKSFDVTPKAFYHGIELNASAREMALIRLELAGLDVELVLGDIFKLDVDDKYDAAFSNYPFGMRAKYVIDDKILDKFPFKSDITNATTMDWLFNFMAVKSVHKDCRSVCIMTNGGISNLKDKLIRKYFVDNGLIEAVIALPPCMFDYCSLPTTMLVLGHSDDGVMFVDAKDICEKGRRLNVFTEKNIDDIVYSVEHETEHSKKVTTEFLKDNNYELCAGRYVNPEPMLENSIPFESVIKNITRGAQIKADEYDKLISQKPTNNLYLNLSNIQNGFIDEDLPCLSTIDERLKKYCIKNHSLIISKSGIPFKIAIAEIEEGKTILANGNFFIIELDETKANPYFIKSFLESKFGATALKNISVGSILPSIGVEQLKKIGIPTTSLEKQNEIANKYLAVVDDIRLLKRKLHKDLNKLADVFEDNLGE